MRGNFNKYQKKRILEFYEEGRSYHNIALLVESIYGISVTDDCIRKMIGRMNGKKNGPKLSRCLILSDLHIPYHRDDILDIVRKHSSKIDTLILAGDILDCESISVYESLGKVRLADEMAEASDLLLQIQDLTPGVKRIAFFGNHESRFERYLATKGGELSSLHSRNILKEVIGGFEYSFHGLSDRVDFPELDYEVVDNWWFKHNDVIVCHPKSFSKIQGRTAVSACEYFTRDGVEFDAIFTAHTHKIVDKVPNLNKWCYEIGCLCQEMPYAKEGKLNYTPQNCGYALVVFENGKFDVNRTRVYVLGDGDAKT